MSDREADLELQVHELQLANQRLGKRLAHFEALLRPAWEAANVAIEDFDRELLVEAPPKSSSSLERTRILARARCHRECISDESRRRALDTAYAAGHFERGFDELSLPWHDDTLALDPRTNPMTSDRVLEGAAGLHDLSSTEYRYWLMTRVAIIAGADQTIIERLKAVWPEIRFRDGSAEAHVILPTHGCVATPDASWFPGGARATNGDLWLYPDGAPLRRDGEWFAPAHAGDPKPVFMESGRPLAQSRLARMAKKRTSSETSLCLLRLGSYEIEIQALALLELAYSDVDQS